MLGSRVGNGEEVNHVWATPVAPHPICSRRALMAASDESTRAAAALRRADVGDDLCAPFLSVLPVAGIAISTVGNPFGSERVCASDAIAARLDEIQIDLGEGPCWEAVRTGMP